MKKGIHFLLLTMIIMVGIVGFALGEIFQKGEGSYTDDWPSYTEYSFERPLEYTGPRGGLYGPPKNIYKTDTFTGPVPTNDWWTSVVWLQHSNRMYSLPLAFQFKPEGLEVTHPNVSVSQNVSGGYWSFSDFTIGGAGFTSNDARLDSVSDWGVDIQMTSANQSITTRLITGSPYVYLSFEGTEPAIDYDLESVYYEDLQGNRLFQPGQGAVTYVGDSIRSFDTRGRYYGWFAPSGTSFSITAQGDLTIALPEGEKWLVVGFLGASTPANWNQAPLGTFTSLNDVHQFFYDHAYAWPTDTRASWTYDQALSEVRVNYSVDTVSKYLNQTETLQGIFPHQYKNMSLTYSGVSYSTCRGQMKVLEGNNFETTLAYHGLLPCLPLSSSDMDLNRLKTYLEDRVSQPIQGKPEITLTHSDWSDSYWNLKWTASLVKLIPIAHIMGEMEIKNSFLNLVKNNLSDWLSYSPEIGENSDHFGKSFVYLNDWKGLFGFLPGYGAEHFNDQHFHYGYLIYSAAILSLYDTSFVSAFGDMVDFVIREVAAHDRSDTEFPFLRYMNVYHGHSWANGSGDSPSGNDQESISEALNAWAGVALWGALNNKNDLRDLGIFLHALEYSAAREYWYDIDRDIYDYTHYNQSYVTSMVWGEKSTQTTWFSTDPEHQHGIIYLPITPSSLYLGLNPTFVQNDYQSLQSETGNNIDQWTDIMGMYRAFFDPVGAANQFSDSGDFENGNSWAFTYHFIHSLKQQGTVNGSVTADVPLYAVFNQGGSNHYVAYNSTSNPITVNFSDGAQLQVEPHSLGATVGYTHYTEVDAVPPTQPSNLEGSPLSISSVHLTWNSSTDNVSVKGYEVFRDGSLVGVATTNAFTDDNLVSGQNYVYSVRAYDEAGNYSSMSSSLTLSPLENNAFPPNLYIDSYGGGGAQHFSFGVSEISLDLNSTTAPFNGSQAIHMRAVSSLTNGNGRFEFYYGENAQSNGLDLGAYNAIECYLKASSPCKVWLRVGSGGLDSGYKQVFVDLTTQYQEFTIDLEQMNLGSSSDINTLLALTIQAQDNGGSFNHDLYLDEVKFLGGSPTSIEAPTDLVAQGVSPSEIELGWTPSISTGVIGYKVYQGGVEVAAPSSNSYIDSSLTPNTSYAYQVSAVNVEGVESDRTIAVEATTLKELPDVILLDVVTDPLVVEPGQLVPFIATIKNQGVEATPTGVTVGVGLWVNEQWVTYCATDSSLLPGEERVISSADGGGLWNPQEGSHNVRAIVDDIDRFEESNEANNTLEKVIVVSPPQNTEYEVYGDALQTGTVHSYLFNALTPVIDLSYSLDVFSGTHCVRLYAKSNPGNANTRFDFYYGENIQAQGLDLTPYSKMEFYIKGSANANIWIRIGDGYHDSGYKQMLSSITPSWQRIEIDLTSFNLGSRQDINTLLALTIQTGDNGGGFDHSIYLDNIKFLE